MLKIKINRKMIECLVTRIMILSVVVVMACCRGGVGAIAKAGCPDECGGVQIPYPFGIGDGCYFNNSGRNYTYEIICDNSTGDLKPTLPSVGEVLSISLEDQTIRISSMVAYDCFDTVDGSVPSTLSNITYNMGNRFAIAVPLVISGTKNKFVSIGYNTSAWFFDPFLMTAPLCTCMTYSTSLGAVSDGSCSGVGCCEASFSQNVSAALLQVSSSSNHTSPLDPDYTYPCSYAFVTEIGWFNFSLTNLTATSKDCYNTRVPLIYDWFVTISGNKTNYDVENHHCSELPNNAGMNMICGSNTQLDCNYTSSEYINMAYHCQCLKGYNDNPYLPDGCKDINECEVETLSNCQRREYCVNKEGGFDCRCPVGQPGNGTPNSPCIPPPLPPSASKLIIGVSTSTGSIITLIILLGMSKLIKRKLVIRKRKQNFKRNGGLLLQQEMSARGEVIDRTKVFRQSELEKATDNFSDNRILGRGGQGTVYKGMLVDGTIVAVKKSKKVGENELAQFINEVVILSQINHRHVVKIFGCCLETKVPLLVYEFIPNGTLYQHIHHPMEDFHLTWKVRFQIAIECAGAIAYLHSSCSSPIYHRDIKSSNILLDEKYKAKIADFGTSRSISIDKTHVTTCVQGTFGYLDPEFFRSSQFSEKSDVYSFGVVILELLTSKKPIFTDICGEPKGLATEFLQLVETNPSELRSFLDPEVLQNCSEEEIGALASLIEVCLSLNGKQRPTMREVAMTLETIKKQHHDDDNSASVYGIRRQENHVRNVEIGIANEDSSFDTSAPTSSISSRSHSIASKEHLLINKN